MMSEKPFVPHASLNHKSAGIDSEWPRLYHPHSAESDDNYVKERALILSPSAKSLRANNTTQAVQLSRFIRKVLTITLFTFACPSFFTFAAVAQTVYHPLVPQPANPASVAAPHDDWYMTVQQKFDRHSGKHADIIFDGDSITNRWETTGKDVWAQYANRAADFGIEGDRTENLLWRLSKGQVDDVDPKLVVLLIGTNNVGRDSVEHLAEGVKTVAAEYERRCPHAHIILMAILPRGRTPDDPSRLKVAAVNKRIATLDDGQHVSFVDIGPQLVETDGTISTDMMPDFVHPTARGYVIWANAIQALIEKYAPERSPN